MFKKSKDASMNSTALMLLLIIAVSMNGFSQVAHDTVPAVQKGSSEDVKEKKEKKWYDALSIRGYAQVRYNQLFVTNPNLTNEQGDKSIGTGNGFFIRRARLILSGRVNEHVAIYFQPDFANNIDVSRQHVVQLRDLYADLGIDKEMVYRFRIGQSKVPFGFENMQSSQNRNALDRSDPINSALSNERDLGVFFYWTPKKIQEIFSDVQNSQMKGSGNYGMFALGAFNGQTGNVQELNSKRHYVARFTYPFNISGQLIETAIQAYTGDFVLIRKHSKIKGENEFKDERVGATFVLYPKPFGIMAEYNIGRGPSFSNTDSTIKVRDLKGGFVQLMYNLKIGSQHFLPYAKYQYYDGGKKHEQDARYYLVNETELGVEWQPVRAFELTVAYSIMDRVYEDYAKMNNRQIGNLLRLQGQVNF